MNILLLISAALWSLSNPYYGEGDVHAQVAETPGYPEAVAVFDNRMYVTTQARFDSAGLGPSTVESYSVLTGAHVGTITLQGEDQSWLHGASGIDHDAQGRLYVLSTQLGMLRFTKQGSSWTQESYSGPFPIVNNMGLPSLPNDMIFLPNGDALVTDSLQAVIWRVPAGGGSPVPWFGSAAIAPYGSAQLGPNGLRLSPDGEWVYFAYSGGPATNEFELERNGAIYRLPVSNPTEANLELVYEYDPYSTPDGISFGSNGKLYVVLATQNAIDVLNDADDPDNTSSVGWITGPSGSSQAFSNPSNMVFDPSDLGRAFVVNHAIFEAPGAPSNPFAILSVQTWDSGAPLVHPNIP